MLQGNPMVERRFARTEKQSEPYFTIGEFVRILGIRKHTLFHCDEIGLFSPALKEENGYRYCLIWQMDMSEVIRALQKLGMSLGEAREYMEDRSPERFVSMVDGKKRQIDEEIRRLRNMKRFIFHEEESVQLAMEAILDEPRLVEGDRECLLVLDISAESEREATVETAKHVRMQEKYRDTVGAVESIYLGEDMDRGTYDRHVRVHTRLDEETASCQVQSRPEGVYVELYSKGYLWGTEKPYRLISAFAGERGIRLGQVWYEDLILDELVVKGCEQHIVKAMVSVESRVMNP